MLLKAQTIPAVTVLWFFTGRVGSGLAAQNNGGEPLEGSEFTATAIALRAIRQFLPA